jgi:hypothetical protein
MRQGDELCDHLVDLAKMSLHVLGMHCSRGILVEAHQELGCAEIKVQLELEWLARVLFGQLWPPLVRAKILDLHRVSRYRDIVLTVVVDVVAP